MKSQRSKLMTNDDIPQSERRQVMENDRLARRASTYLHQAQANADLELGGSYAKVTKTTVVGSGHIAYPQLPEGNPFKSDPVPIEPPLNYNINDQPATGEIWEQEQSMKIQASSSTVVAQVDDAVGTSPSVSVAAGAGRASTFRRRI
jgi:hypothetical protein